MSIETLTLAVTGAGLALARYPELAAAATWGGVAFLVAFGEGCP